MKPYVITIARQYGSGGKTVGKMLADKLGIPFCGADLLYVIQSGSTVMADVAVRLLRTILFGDGMNTHVFKDVSITVS